MSKDVNKTASHLTSQNEMVSTDPQAQGGEALREQIEAIYLNRLPNPETGLYDVKSSIDDLEQLFAAEHARLLFSLRGKMPKDGEYARVDGKPGNQVEQAWDSGWNNATDQAIAAIDAELDRLKETKE